MDDLYRIILQKRLLHQICQPLRRGYDGHIHAGQQLLLLLIQHFAPVKEQAVFPILRAIGASRPPLIAFCNIKVGTVRSKCPAVMKRPKNLDMSSCQKVKKLLQIAIVAMNIMKMDDIRPDFVQMGNQSSCNCFGIKPIAAIQVRS